MGNAFSALQLEAKHITGNPAKQNGIRLRAYCLRRYMCII